VIRFTGKKGGAVPLFCALMMAVFIVSHAPPMALADAMAEGARAYDGGDYQAAFHHWRAAAAHGDARAEVALAGLYLSGEGVPRDVAEAVYWYRRAAYRGDSYAQQQLGDILATGQLGRPNLIEGLVWLTLAAEQGRTWASRRRNVLQRNLSDRQREMVARRVAAFKPRPAQ
jgi:TPR repeat protein